MSIIGPQRGDVKDFPADTSRTNEVSAHIPVTTGKRYQYREKGIAVWVQVTGKGPLHPNIALELAVSKHYFYLFRSEILVTLYFG